MQLKSGFTMIELIFVIVILGVLASVAIPKLAATRDDAEISVLSANLKTAISEIMAVTLSKGKLDSNITAMSQSLTALVASGKAVKTANKYSIKVGNQADCVILDINGSQDIIVDVQFTAGTDAKCSMFQQASDLDHYKLKIRGANVIR